MTTLLQTSDSATNITVTAATINCNADATDNPRMSVAKSMMFVASIGRDSCSRNLPNLAAFAFFSGAQTLLTRTIFLQNGVVVEAIKQTICFARNWRMWHDNPVWSGRLMLMLPVGCKQQVNRRM